MNATVERLQTLLEAVQRNRRVAAGRRGAVSQPAQAGMRAAAQLDPEVLAGDEFPIEPERGSIPISLDPGDVPPAPVEVPRAAAVPFEAHGSTRYGSTHAGDDSSFESFGEVEVGPSDAPPAAPTMSAGADGFDDAYAHEAPADVSASEPPTQGSERPMFAASEASFESLPDAEGQVIAAPPVREPSRPIAHVVSRHPTTETPTFGKLLLRSLSLRAR